MLKRWLRWKGLNPGRHNGGQMIKYLFILIAKCYFLSILVSN